MIPLGVTDWFLEKSKLTRHRQRQTICERQHDRATKEHAVSFCGMAPPDGNPGASSPRLVLVGHRGWENENVIDVLERSRGLAPFLVEASGLSDAGLASLVRGATAVVGPSSVEGFGLPVAEALSLGVPVIASDISAHKEVGGRWTTLSLIRSIV